MFTVCPKCALTLVVTAQDLRVAQGYVRCGRCSNVFNAIVGLTDDRGALANSGPQSTATTSIIRKAPSISEDDPAVQDSLGDTSESEAIYAEPDENEVKFQEVFAEPTPSTRAPARAPSSTPEEPAQANTSGPISFTAPPPESYVASASTPVSPKPPDAEKRYSDTEGIDTYPESELEFNPDVTDVTKVFVEAAPVTFKGDATGRFRKFVMGEERPDPELEGEPDAFTASGAPGDPVAFDADLSSSGKTDTSASASGPARTPAYSIPPPGASGRDEEDVEIDSDLRALANRLDVTSNRPMPKFPPVAANDEAVDNPQDEGRGLGDIYAMAVPRPRPPAPPQSAASGTTAVRSSGSDDRSDFGAGAETQAVDSAIETFTPAAPPRSRSMWWVGGAAVLSLLLVGQVIHHNRHALATKPLLNRPLTKFYKAIGVPLVPSWDLRAYDVRQLGASTNESGEGTLTVRASLKNDSSQPLPLPLLRITMQDRYGNRIATRDVPPSGYVPGALPPEAHLGVGQRIDAEMTFKDPGQNAVGFEIDACLPTASGRVACANDQPPAPR